MYSLGSEAAYLLINEAFNRGYRRVDWSSNNLNEPSKRAAERLGFTFEAIHRQSLTYNGNFMKA